MKRFFNLPILQTYVVLLILLITLIFVGSSLVKSTLLYVIPNQQTQMEKVPQYNNLDNRFVFTDAATKYYKEYAENTNKNINKQNYLKELIKAGLTLLIALPFFYLYWRRSKFLDEDNTVQFTVKNFYFYTVCTITFFIAFFSTVGTINTFVEYKYPSRYVIDINEIGLQIVDKKMPVQNNQKPITIDTDKVKEAIEDRQRLDTGWQYDNIIQNITSIIVALPIFFLHWRPIRKLGIIE